MIFDLITQIFVDFLIETPAGFLFWVVKGKKTKLTDEIQHHIWRNSLVGIVLWIILIGTLVALYTIIK
jgi:hypothetical protein